MKRTAKLLILCVLAVLCLLFTAACLKNKEYKVLVSPGEGAIVKSENPLRIKHGESATFELDIERGYCFLSADGASYDQDTGILTVEGVTANTNINFRTEEYPYDPDATFAYIFKSDYSGDTTSIKPGSAIPAARLITVCANDKTRKFVGWSLDGAAESEEDVISTDRVFSFRVSPELAEDGLIRIYANYSDVNKIIYNLNGGSVNTSTVNMRGNPYAYVENGNGEVTVRFTEEYLSFMECASTFWDDGSFYKDGAVLTEYNTAPDGSGEAYSLGSKVPLVFGGEQTVLYCIWSQATPDTRFTVSAEIEMPSPATKAEYAPDWQTRGVMITGYDGNADKVVIPEKIDGKPVIGIARGAFENCSMTTLVLGRNIQKIEDGAFVNCTSLSTVHYPDGIYYITDAAFDARTTSAIRHLYVNATVAPRYASPDVGGLAVKLSRVLAPTDSPRIIVIAGSSSYQGLGTEYMEALLNGEYRVVNFGTTRTTHGLLYLEAMGHLTDSDDVVLYAPENSSYMFGERELYWKTMRDLEGMVNIYRYVDISKYTGVFDAFAGINEYRYAMAPITYESVCEGARPERLEKNQGMINKYGDYQKSDRVGVAAKYYDSYHITLNEYVKSKDEGAWNDVGQQQANSNYLDPNNKTWCKITDAYYLDTVNHAINAAKSGGARVYFSFCPVEGDKLVDGADTTAWLDAYDSLIDEIYAFDGRVGGCRDYVFASEYFYDNAFHLNDYGRTYRTYQLYTDLLPILGITEAVGQNSLGTDFEGCLFDGGTIDEPVHPWAPKN